MKSATDRHWNERAITVAEREKVNIADTAQRDLELDFVFPALSPKMKVLEVGCGNGYVTQILRERVAHVDAFDYAENMVASALESYGERNNRFFHDNVLSPSNVRGPYDAVVCIRVLINLRNLSEQIKAIEQMAALLKPSGTLVLAEGFLDGFMALNELRAKSGLQPLTPASINFYSRVEELLPTIEKLFEVKQQFHLGLFDVLTRGVYPALVGAENATGPADFHLKIMPVVRALPTVELDRYSRIRGFVLRRR